MVEKELCALRHSLAVLPWAPHLIESRVHFGADFRGFPRVWGTLLVPLLNQGLPKCRGLAGARLYHLALAPAPNLPSHLGGCSVPRCCPTHPNESVPRWAHV